MRFKNFRKYPFLLWIACAISLNTYATTISTNTSWTGNSVPDDLIILNGFTLTVDLSVYPGDTWDVGGKIDIQKGGKLIIIGATGGSTVGIKDRIILESDYTATGTPTVGAIMTANNCKFVGWPLATSPSNKWHGIEVWGMNVNGPGKDQTYSAKLSISNSSISYARFGVANCADPGSVRLFQLYSGVATGGIIQADNVTFNNNLCSVFLRTMLGARYFSSKCLRC